MILKPFRSYDEAEVINLYSLAENSGNAGDLVEYQAWNPAADDAYDANQNLAPFAGMFIPRYVNAAKVKLATSGGEKNVAGMLLVDVRETDALGRKLIYDAQRYQELNVVTSGQTVPMLKRGIVWVSGFTGHPAPGSGIGVSDNGNGQWTVRHPDEAWVTDTGILPKPSLGRFLSSTGADGYACAFVQIP